DPPAPHVVDAIVEIAEQALLTEVEVERADGMAGTDQRSDEMHRRGGLAGAALLVAQHDHMRHAPPPECEMARSVRIAPPDLADDKGSAMRSGRYQKPRPSYFFLNFETRPPVSI